MNETLFVVNCSQLVTLAGPRRPRVGGEMRELAIIADGAMLVRDGRVERTGTRREIEPLAGASCEVLDAGGRVVLPGFVDAHAHPVFAGNRADEFEKRAAGLSYQEIAAAGGGIGTTTVEAKSGYGLTLEDELKMLGVVRRLNAEGRLAYVPTFLGAHEVPDEYRERRGLYVDLVVEEMLPRVAREGLAEFCDVFCEERVFTLGESRRVLEAARGHGLALRVHADQLTRGGGALLAASLGAKTADHLEYTDAEGIAALKAAGVQPVLLPGSVYALGSARYPAAREMIEAGLGVVVATDFNPGSSPTPAMTMILSLASTHMKMTPAEGITAATVNAAYSMNRGDRAGTLEAGKRADFVVHDCADYRELAYFFGVEHAHAVFVGGRAAFARGRVEGARK
jgi:imidazolonepropionase